MEAQHTAPTGRRKLKPSEWAAGAVTVVSIGAIVAVFFTLKICDEQLADTGSVVKVCRFPQLTDPPIVVFGAMILVSLGVFFSEISGFGITLKRAVEKVERTAEKAERTAEKAERTAQDAEHTAQAAAHEVRQTSEDIRETAGDLGEGVKEALSQARPPDPAAVSEEADPVKQLAARYNEIRWTMPSGDARTIEMTALVNEMITLLKNRDGFDVENNLRSRDRGMRLAAVAYLYANPDPALAGQLAKTAVSEDKPFNEYWALLALRKVLQGHCDALDSATRERLQQRRARLASGTDRAQQIDQLLRECPQR